MSTGATVTALHGWHHDSYDEAVAQIHQALGSIDDIEVFGRQVLVACYIRPKRTGKGLYMTTKQQTEDIFQGKAVLILKMGPDAGKGTPEFIAATWGAKGAPAVGDWVFLRSSDGLPISLVGDGAKRIQARDHEDNQIDVFEWDGWPCRIITDESIVGRMNKPHSVV